MENFAQLFMWSRQLDGVAQKEACNQEGGAELRRLDHLIALYSPPALINDTWKIGGISESRWDWETRMEAEDD